LAALQIEAEDTLIPNLPPPATPTNTTMPSAGESRKIAFMSDRDGNNEIYVMNTDGSGQKNLTNYPAEDAEPAWSPDGTRIAFTSLRDGNFEIYVMNTDSSGQKISPTTRRLILGPHGRPMVHGLLSSPSAMATGKST